MFFSTVITSFAFMSATGWAQYVLEDDYTNGNFFDMFTFFNTSDPTNGFVDYVGQDYANDAGLINSNSGQIYMGVDYTSVASSSGRPSVRITSNKSYNSGLIILDLEHMPGGICGTWPAFWMVGPDWPSNGEIDIIEGVNDQTTNDMTLHTGPDCSISSSEKMQGSISTDNCDVNAEGQSANAGCQIGTEDSQTFGSGFNANKGGVYATEWTDSSIKIFFFPRNSIPSDITSSSPEPSSWGTPYASFQGGCDISETFSELQIVFDTTFCGDWAGNTWASSSCSAKADTCTDFVKNNPSAFEDAYWAVNSLKVYQSNGASSSSKIVNSQSTSFSSTISNQVSHSTSASSIDVSSSSVASFALSSKPSSGLPTVTGFPHPPLPPNATATFAAGNSTKIAFLTGSSAAPIGTAASTGFASTISQSQSSISRSSLLVAAPSSPPEIPSQAAIPPSSVAASSAVTGTQAAGNGNSRSWHSRGGNWEYGPVSHEKRHERHLKHHKRHGGGRL